MVNDLPPRNTTPAQDTDKVTFDLQEGVAVLTINNPPVNAGSFAVRAGLLAGLEWAAAHHAQAMVILGAGRCFIAGSDLREFNAPLAYPELPDVIKAIEAVPFPVIAALHGVALGGGLELALGCDYRVAAKGTKVGLPEVSLGFVPGAGGTQRLSRLVGVATSIQMICDASRISAEKAQSIGLVDAVYDTDLRAAALAFAKEVDGSKRIAMDMVPPQDDTAAIEVAEARALRRGKGRPNVDQAIRLIKAAGAPNVYAVAALADERAVFQRLRVSDDAFALRYLFFSERLAGSVDGIDPKAAASVTRVGVVGGGTMGQGIVRAFLAAEFHVTVVERDADALQTALTKIQDSLQSSVEKGRLSADACTARLAQLEGATQVSDLADCDLAIEAVFEDMDVKKQVLGQLEAVMAQTAIIATNTSYLDVDDMVSDLAQPERVIGLHFFSPADIMPLLEIVRASKTSDKTLATGLKLGRALKKQPVVSCVAEGFIGNRIYNAYRRRAELLVLDGASPEQVDQAIKEFGFAMGPFAVSDMSGLDIAWAMRKRQAASRNPKARYVTIADSLCEAGRLGRKTSKGWYDYAGGKAAPSADVAAVIDAARGAAGVTVQNYDAYTIARQLLAAMVNEAALLLDEGVAQRASDVDVTLCNGYGFPRWRGGALYWASQQDPEQMLADLDELGEAIGHGFQRGPVANILAKLKAAQSV